jgi:hypothetical protein
MAGHGYQKATGSNASVAALHTIAFLMNFYCTKAVGSYDRLDHPPRHH